MPASLFSKYKKNYSQKDYLDSYAISLYANRAVNKRAEKVGGIEFVLKKGDEIQFSQDKYGNVSFIKKTSVAPATEKLGEEPESRNGYWAGERTAKNKISALACACEILSDSVAKNLNLKELEAETLKWANRFFAWLNT